MKPVPPLHTGQYRFADANQTITRAANPNHFPDIGKMLTRDHFVGFNKMVGSGQSSEGSLCLRANGASTRQPRATPWELGHPNIYQP